MHINKTAGTSIERALGYGKGRKHQATPALIETYGEKTWNEYLTFTFVRNPWDRMVSLFFWRKGRGVVPKDLSFEEFVLNWDHWHNYGKARGRPLLVKSQIDWFDEKYNFDFIGRFENLQEDFDKVCDKLGTEKVKLTHIHKTNHKHYPFYYNEKIKNKVYEIWGEDAKAFNYEFEPN